MLAWEITGDGGVDQLALNERPLPEPGPGQVRVAVKASSINYRDLATIEDPVARKLPYPTIPNSDGAGVISAVGPGVTGWRAGDWVMGCFFQEWESGPCSVGAMTSALGGARDGVLAEEIILSANGIIRIPAELSFEQAATLPCAALTAWHALTQPAPVLPGETVLLLGTGGVSVFAQQFCQIMGAATIVTSSSDLKLERMRQLGAGAGINYRTNPDWEQEVLRLTSNMGVDRVVEVGGPGTLQKSITSVRVGGQISLIGILTGVRGQIVPTDIMRKSITMRGIYVGPRQMFYEMNRAIDQHGIEPVIDRTVAFEDARSAYHAMRAGEHFGKIVIKIAKN